MRLNNKKKKFITGLAHGVFDILHIGHVEYFKKAKSICDKLVVSVTVDKFVNKGADRPAFSIKDRVKMLKSIKFIDEVVISYESTAVNVIKHIKPDLYIKGKDYKNLVKHPTKNLKLEIQAVKNIGGDFVVINTNLKSSSKILNENYNYLDKDVIKFLKTIDKNKLQLKLKAIFFKPSRKKILVIGEPIIDVHCNVKVLGKAQKSNVVSTAFVKNQEYGGGVILASNFLNEFFDHVDLLAFFNSTNDKFFNKYLNAKIRIKKINSQSQKIIQKKRFVDSYSKNKLFQINYDEKYILSDKNKKLYLDNLKRIFQKYDELVIFDYGYGYMFKECLDFIKKYPKKININCQTNSSNFGFNLISKYENGNIIAVDEVEFRLSVQDKTESIPDLIIKNRTTFKKYNVFIITSGDKGCYIVSKNKFYYVPTVFKNTFDTTGCGDVFYSAFVFFYSLKTFTLSEIGLLSHIAAGMHANIEGNKNLINKDKLFQIIQTIIK